jgi:hypothetical protein
MAATAQTTASDGTRARIDMIRMDMAQLLGMT